MWFEIQYSLSDFLLMELTKTTKKGEVFLKSFLLNFTTKLQYKYIMTLSTNSCPALVLNADYQPLAIFLFQCGYGKTHLRLYF